MFGLSSLDVLTAALSEVYRRARNWCLLCHFAKSYTKDSTALKCLIYAPSGSWPTTDRSGHFHDGSCCIPIYTPMKFH